ncbi:vWA domain-containing protein [Nitrospirillum sp. BR 11828]|uniref:vWA domain-containing protein n=1 Tax=Nitrospirillum sp. BR 11828 TaxID=3104325 RepID=UPI002ACACA3C|nr:vWA domain-containing protein [Nitrospirillum sp. BR 11828]MDZ5650009.1 vWA domain-containing protein [Nitrospirillum sp. BR 11828]
MTAPFARLIRRNVRDPRTLALAAALVLAIAAVALPRLPITRDGVRVLVVVDITGSMNTRDYGRDGAPVSRLAVAKEAVRDLLGRLPCPSRVGLALFSERVPFLLFEPVDVCRDYGAVEGAVDALDWREGWEGDSHIAEGLYGAIAMAQGLDSDLMFITDGQETPPLPLSGGPVFDGKPGAVRGVIVGAGGYSLAPIPKFDDRGNEVGFWGVNDVQHENHFGAPPPDAESRPGYQARNAPFGSGIPTGTEHLSSVREPYLRGLAGGTGLTYTHLEDGRHLARALLATATPRPSPALADVRWVPGAGALAALLAAYGLIPVRGWRPTVPGFIKAVGRWS